MIIDFGSSKISYDFGAVQNKLRSDTGSFKIEY